MADRCNGAAAADPAEATVAPSPTPPTLELLPQLPEDTGNGEWTWGPGRPTYTHCAPAGHAAINSIVEDDGSLDERRFFFLQRGGSDTQLRDIELRDGESYHATIYFWNDVAENISGGATQNAKLRLTLPKYVADTADSRAEICADNATPRCVWMTLALSTSGGETLQLSVREESIAMYVGERTFPLSRADLDDQDGVLLGCDGHSGILDGSGECRGSIQFDIDVHAPESELIVSTSTGTFDRKVRPGSTLHTTLTYATERASAPESLHLGMLVPRGLRVPTTTLQISAWDSSTLSWSAWTDIEARHDVSTGALYVEIPEPARSSERVSIMATLKASTDLGFECGGNWVEIVGYASDSGVTQTKPAILTIEPTC